MTRKEKIRRLVQDTDTCFGRVFDWVVVGLIIYSIITLTIESFPDIPSWSRQMLWYSEIVVTLLFTIEYALRTYIAEPKTSYIFSWGGFIDILAISPFYITLVLGLGGVDLRAARAFRLLRILRLLKIGRYNKAMARFNRAYEIAKEEINLYLMLSGILLFISATGIYYFENLAQPEAFKSIVHSLWWAVATLSTVGYGDVYPVTLGGKLFTSLVIVVGIGILAVPSGLMASALNKARREEDAKNKKTKESKPFDS